MSKRLLVLITVFFSYSASAGISDLFRDEQGNTNWQHLANWSSGTLIIILGLVIMSLFFAHSRLSKTNKELQIIRAELEDRVIERTATLDQSNQKLTQTNQLLEVEVNQHIKTTQKLLSSESYIKDILTSMPLVLVSLNARGYVTQWNRRAEEITGISSTAAIGKNLWDVYPEVILSWEQVEEVIANGEVVTYPHRQRAMYYYDITLYPLKSNESEGVVILVNDVSKQKHAEDMLIHNEKISSMTELASAMAHDINTPLQGILLDLQSFQQLMSRQTTQNDSHVADPEKLNRLLVDASDRAEKVASIVNNLLTFSRGRNEEKQKHQVTELLDNALMLADDMLLLPGELQLESIHIEKKYQDNLPLLSCYATELQQVFLNLIRHSCYAFEKKPAANFTPNIRISAKQDLDSIWISFYHNGEVLSDEEQTRLFEPSLSVIIPQRDVDSAKRLSFSNFIITEQHQGQMAVTSDVENGTYYHMQLMLEPVA